MKRILVLALLATTGAHAAPASKADKAVIIDYMRNNLADPYSMRSTGISEPVEIKTEGGSKTAVCIEYNAKNEAGGYDGINRIAFIVTPSGLVRGDGYHHGVYGSSCWAAHITMRPFPELAAIR